MMQDKALHLAAQGVEEGATVFARDVPLFFQAFQILSYRCFRYLESRRQVAYARRAFLLDPFQDTAAAGFGQQSGHVSVAFVIRLFPHLATP